MTYEAFLELLKAAEIPIQDNSTLEVSWTTGGDRGGDCWGNEYGPYEAEEEPEFTILDDTLRIAAPTITFLQYKKLSSDIVRRSYRTRDDYYGQHEDITTKKVLLRELFAWLEESRLLD